MTDNVTLQTFYDWANLKLNSFDWTELRSDKIKPWTDWQVLTTLWWSSSWQNPTWVFDKNWNKAFYNDWNVWIWTNNPLQELKVVWSIWWWSEANWWTITSNWSDVFINTWVPNSEINLRPNWNWSNIWQVHITTNWTEINWTLKFSTWWLLTTNSEWTEVTLFKNSTWAPNNDNQIFPNYPKWASTNNKITIWNNSYIDSFQVYSNKSWVNKTLLNIDWLNWDTTFQWAIKVWDSALTCWIWLWWLIRYNESTKEYEYCNETEWTAFWWWVWWLSWDKLELTNWFRTYTIWIDNSDSSLFKIIRWNNFTTWENIIKTNLDWSICIWTWC